MKKVSLTAIIVLMVATLFLSGCSSLLQAEAVTQPVANVPEVATVPQVEPAKAAPPALSENQNVDDALATLLAQEQVLADVYRRVNPAVVNIQLTQGEGSGFVYDASGYIVTNNHVVEQGGPIRVAFADGTEMDAQLVGRDPDSDLAVIKVDAAPGQLTAVSLADSSALQVGQMVIAIGNPFGLQGSMTTGIVSGLGRLLEGARYSIPDIIQTDAAVNPGNSGGPLLDLYGNVIGVNSAIASPVRGSSGVGYAVPVNIVKVVVPQLIANGRVSYPWLGVSGGTLTAIIAENLGLNPNQRGALIAEVVPNGPADVAGLQGGDVRTNAPGDVIVGVDGQPVQDFDDLLAYVVQNTSVGQTIDLQVLRNGEVQTVPLTLQERP